MKKRVMLNEPQCKTINFLKGIIMKAHEVDIVLRIDGKDLTYEADWLKKIIPELKPNEKFEL